MSNLAKRTLAVLLAVALTLSNFPEAFFSTITGISFTTEITAEGEDGETGSTGTSSNDADETEAETEEETSVVVVEIETEAEEETSEEGSSMLLSASANSFSVQDKLDEFKNDGTATHQDIFLNGDVIEDIIVWQGLDVTIDLAGYTITPASDGASAITVYGTLTLIDSGTDGAVSNENTGFTNIRGVDVVQGGSFTMKSGTITGFTVTGNGGGILVENGGSISMTGGKVDGNAASGYGGGVFLYSADYMGSLTGGTISNNSAGLSGGGLAANITNSGSITLNKDLTISGNTAATYGGGVYFANAVTNLTISSTISGNTSANSGGGVYFGAAIEKLTISGAEITGNKSTGAAGGGCYFAAKVTDAEITGDASISKNNAAGNGGGLWFTSGTTLTLTSGTIDGNIIEANGALYGAGIYLNSSNSSSTTRSKFTSTGGIISNNEIKSSNATTSYGGGIYIGSYATVNMNGTSVTGNEGATNGGGIAIGTYAQNVTLTNLTVLYNSADASSAYNSGSGGGVWVGDNSANTITVSGGTYDHNTANYRGGAMYVTKTLKLTGAVTISNNTAYSDGGGVRVETLIIEGGTTSQETVTINNNVAQNGGGGGAYAGGSTEYALTVTGYVEVYENKSLLSYGGGLAVYSGGMYLNGENGNISVHNNSASSGGGLSLYVSSANAGTLHLEGNVSVCENTVISTGGGVYSSYLLEIGEGVSISDNYATSNAGGAYAKTIVMTGGSITGNSAANGGGLFDNAGLGGSEDGESHISGGTICNNTARTGSGGGIYIANSTSASSVMNIEETVEIYGNTAYSNGGGIWTGDKLIVAGGSIHDNTAQIGGGIYIVGYQGQTVEIKVADGKEGIIYDNTATKVTSGNDIALAAYQTTKVYSDTNSTNSYATLTIGAASTFTDDAEGITGEAWYDEKNAKNETGEISVTNESGGTYTSGAYYTFVYTKSGVYVAEVWKLTGEYEKFTTVQAAVTAVANANETTYGNEDGGDDPVTIIMIDDSREVVTIPDSLEVALDLNDCTLRGMAGSTITVAENASLTIEDNGAESKGQITGGNGSADGSWNNCGGGLFIKGSATLISGTITENYATYGSGVYVASTGSFTMSGGAITKNGNTSVYGGGIAVKGSGSDTTSFTMTGGSIADNTASTGGGIWLYNTKTEISGGSITGNIANGQGGGIYTNNNKVAVIITGGEITGNTAKGTNGGGGIYITQSASTLTISGGKVYDNTATIKTANDIYASNSNSGSLSILSASDMIDSPYNSWYDAKGDDTSYPYYYTSSITGAGSHVFALTATKYSNEYVAYIPSDNGYEIYQVADNSGGETTYSYTTDSGASTTYAKGAAYTTLQAAINASTSSDVIYLLCDQTEDVTVSGKTVTIDLNGYTLYTEDDYGFKLTQGTADSTVITIRDTSQETDVQKDTFHNPVAGAVGTLTPSADNTNEFPRAIYSTATATYPSSITIDGVTIKGYGNESKAVAGIADSSLYYGGAIYGGTYLTLTVKGYSVLEDNAAYYGGAIHIANNNTSLTIEDNVIITGNTAYQGGGIYYNSSSLNNTYTTSLSIGKATLSYNTAYQGGAIFVSGWSNSGNTSASGLTKVTLENTVIEHNQATNSTGGVYIASTAYVKIYGCQFNYNTSDSNYGALYLSTGSAVGPNAVIDIEYTSFDHNEAAIGYGGMTVSYGTLTMDQCTFTNQSASGIAALYVTLVNSGSTIKNTSLSSNTSAKDNFILYIVNSTISLESVTVTGNTTQTGRGAVYIQNSSTSVATDVTLTDCEISDNSCYGLQIQLQGTQGVNVTLKGDTKIHENGDYGVYMVPYSNNTYRVLRDKIVLNIQDSAKIYENGNSGVYSEYSTVNMSGGEIYSNTATGNGGGINAPNSNFNMSGGSIHDNTATSSGGGVYIAESANTYGITTTDYSQSVEMDTITGGKIYNNTANNGGGIYTGDYNTLNMTGGSVTGNTATTNGGGVYLSGTYAAYTLAADDTAGTVGKVYDNKATLGQDVYAYYNTTYPNTANLNLVIASSMFTTAEGKTGIGWLNESTNVVTKTSIDYNPVRKAYPLTLEYETGDYVAVIWNAYYSRYDAFTSVQAAVDALYNDYYNNDGNNYYYTTEIDNPEIILIDDATGNVNISAGLNLTINLNGYTLKGLSTAITCAGTLNIKDVQYESGALQGTETYCAHYDALLTKVRDVYGDSDITSVGAGTDSTGTITGTAGVNGGGVYVSTGGYVTMLSGQIANCTAGGTSTSSTYGGAGVYIENGTFILGGTASINNCTTKAYGSAVYLNSVTSYFYLQDNAVIEDNSAANGTVYVGYGTFKMTGGAIQNNSVTNYGGGIYTNAGTSVTKITGGSISGNSATYRGGGIYMANGTVTLSGDVSITDNYTTTSYSSTILNGAGGGIFVAAGTLNIKSQVKISGNTGVRGGGIYQHSGTINMSGGQITGNTASLGGGLAQNPTSSSAVFNMTDGVLCDNKSSLSGAGNDIYSLSETGDTAVSKVTLIAAADMDYTGESYNASYNVWKNDNSDGDPLEGSITDGAMYVTNAINTSTGLQLTAYEYGETAATAKVTSTFKVSSLVVNSIVDGDGFDTTDGDVTAYNTTDSTNATWIDSSDYGDLTKNPTANAWTAGDDLNGSNGLVRTYDKITYKLGVTVQNTDTGGEAIGSNTLYVRVKLYNTESEAEFDTGTLAGQFTSYKTSVSDDDTYLILEGYMPITSQTGTVNVVINVKDMKNGDVVTPEFEAWIEGNKDNEETPAKTVPTGITVSAKGMYDLTLLRNETLSYTGYFNLTTGEETTKEAYENNTSGDTIVYGTMLGYGITLSMRNANTSNKKGMESPTGNITFDLSLTGELYFDGDPLGKSTAPYIWAYKENENTSSGNSLNNQNTDVNMNWNDEDDIASTTQYAYNAAPFNTGGSNSYSCYYGGAWTASGSQPGTDDTSTTVSFTVSSYAIDSAYTNYNPSNASDDSSPNFSGNNIKPFSAGYIQVIFPIDPTVVSGKTGYLSIDMQGIVSTLSISDSNGVVQGKSYTETDEDLEFFVDYYGTTEYTNYATGEVLYINNYVSSQTGLYVTSGSGQSLIKTNYFNDSNNSEMTGEDGNGSTGIGTVVYIGGDVNFSSNAYNTTDKTSTRYNIDYDAENGDNVVEYDYLTAFNLLQKFDAEAYTVDALDLGEVVGWEIDGSSDYCISDTNGNVIFEITTDETATSWSTTKTRSYTLTILYAAIPDGEDSGRNWKDSTDTKGYETPVGEMDTTTEEDLIYFTTLQDLYDYFGYDEDGNPKGCCVAILYEFRDCCIRTGRQVSVTSRMNVTNDFDDAGLTFCTTNDVRGWTTYRPLYKAIYQDSLNGLENREDYLYNFSWWDYVNDKYSTGEITVYGDGTGNAQDSAESDKYQSVTYPMSGYSTALKTGYEYTNSAVLETYNEGYIQTQYSGGWKAPETHTGWYKGNTLLLYTMESGIKIEVADKVQGTTESKSTYSLGSERTASFTVTPTIKESSAVSNELVTNGTQATDVTITITLPRYLNLDEGSISFDYDDKDHNSDYEEGDLKWNITVTKDTTSSSDDEDSTYGVTVITLTTSVTDISKVLPTINYTCTIGEPGATADDPDEPSETYTTLTSTAEINVTYEETGKLSTYAKEAEASITCVRNDSDSIWVVGDGKKELGEDIVFSAYYRNTGTDPANIELIDILPYVGDGANGRIEKDGVSSSFTGGYQVTSITLTFADSVSYEYFVNGGALIYKTDVEYSSDETSGQPEIYDEMLGTGATAVYDKTSGGISFSGTTSELTPATDGSAYTVTFDLSSLDLTQLATNTNGGIAFYVYLPSVQASTKDGTKIIDDKKVQIDFTLSPDKTVNGSTTLISDNNLETQESGNVYYDNAFYRNTAISYTPVTSNLGNSQVIGRELTGIAWLDMDHDGLYNTSSDSTESQKTLKDIEVSLYSTYEPEKQAGWDDSTSGKVTKDTDYQSTGETRWVQTVGGVEIALGTTTLVIDGVTVTLYPVIDVLGNLVTSTTTNDSGKYSFENLAATYVDAVDADNSEQLYVVFEDNNTEYYTVNTGTSDTSAPLSYGQLSVTLYNADWKKDISTSARNISQAYYGDGTTNTSSTGSPAQLKLAYVNEITMPTLEEIQEEKYIKSNVNSGYYYRELTVEKIWQNMISGVDDIEKDTTVTVTVRGTSKGTDGSNPGINYTYDNTYVFTQTVETTGTDTYDATTGVVTSSSGEVTAEYVDGYIQSSIGFEKITVVGVGKETTNKTVAEGYSKPSFTVSKKIDTTTGLETITWSLGTIALQAEDDNGVITYDLVNLTETVPDSSGGTGAVKNLTGYVKETEVVQEEDDDDPNTEEAWKSPLTARVTNTQILYELKLSKISSSSDGSSNILYLAGAEFTLYSDEKCETVVKKVTSSGLDPDDNTIGEILFSYLKPGTYYLKETKAPSGYELNQGVWEIEIVFDNTYETSSFTVTLIKDQETGETISNGTSYTRVDSYNNAGTGASEYIVTGYESDGTTVTSVVKDTALYSISFEIKNEVIYSLPSIGRGGIGWMTLGGIALMLLAVWLLLRGKEKNKIQE